MLQTYSIPYHYAVPLESQYSKTFGQASIMVTKVLCILTFVIQMSHISVYFLLSESCPLYVSISHQYFLFFSKQVRFLISLDFSL